jgi:hypothetical protein
MRFKILKILSKKVEWASEKRSNYGTVAKTEKNERIPSHMRSHSKNVTKRGKDI